MRALRTAVAGVLAATLLTLGGGAPASAATKSCFGAAARDAARPCSGPTASVKPGLDDDRYRAGARCRPRDERPSSICTFGASARAARGHVALVGDSHALHWRSAVAVAARAYRWQGFSITAPGCLFSIANALLHEGIRGACEGWHREALRWFRKHPEVTTVFVSQNTETPVAPRAGTSAAALKIAGYRALWTRLPRTVERVIVIRDTPLTSEATVACLRRALAARVQDPGRACPQPRSASLRRDTAVAAARALRSPRYRTVDLSEFFCDRHNCFSVVGGARVFDDTVGHITTTYARSLGPYLLRKVRRIMRSR